MANGPDSRMPTSSLRSNSAGFAPSPLSSLNELPSSQKSATVEWVAAIALALPFVERPSTTLSAFLAMGLAVVATTLVHRDLGKVPFSPYFPFVLYLWWAAVSVIWSDHAGATISNAVVHVTYLVTACCIVSSQTDYAGIVRVWRRAGCMYVAVSTALALAVPRYGRMMDPPFNGQWRGLAAHKSGFGTFALLLGLPLLLDGLSSDGGRHRGRTIVVAAGFCGVILLSGSATAIVALGCAIVFKVALYMRPARGLRGRTAVYFVVPVGGAAATLLWPLADDAASLVGRDSSLTGRTNLWSIVLKQIERRPLQGFGFHAQWHDPTGVTLRIWNAIHVKTSWTPAIAHNSGLEVLLSLGVVGLIIILFGYVQVITRALRLASRDRTTWAVLPFMAVIVLTCYAVSERGIGQDQGFFFLAFVASIVIGANRLVATDPGITRMEPVARE